MAELEMDTPPPPPPPPTDSITNGIVFDSVPDPSSIPPPPNEAPSLVPLAQSLSSGGGSGGVGTPSLGASSPPGPPARQHSLGRRSAVLVAPGSRPGGVSPPAGAFDQKHMLALADTALKSNESGGAATAGVMSPASPEFSPFSVTGSRFSLAPSETGAIGGAGSSIGTPSNPHRSPLILGSLARPTSLSLSASDGTGNGAHVGTDGMSPLADDGAVSPTTRPPASSLGSGPNHSPPPTDASAAAATAASRMFAATGGSAGPVPLAAVGRQGSASSGVGMGSPASGARSSITLGSGSYNSIKASSIPAALAAPRSSLNPVLRPNGSPLTSMYSNSASAGGDASSDSFPNGGTRRISSVGSDASTLTASTTSTTATGTGVPPSLMSASNGATSSAASDSNYTFAAVLFNDFEGAAAQVEQGLYSVKRLIAVARKVAQAEQDHYISYQKMLQHETTKADKIALDGIVGVVDLFTETKAAFQRLMETHKVLAEGIEERVHQPLVAFLSQAEGQLRSIVAEEQKYSKEMAQARSVLVKYQKECLKLHAQATKALNDEKASKDKALKDVSTKETSGGFFSSLKMKFSSDESKKLIEKLAVSSKLYLDAVLAANVRQQRYVESDLPRVFDALETLEKLRIEVVKDRVGILQSLFSNSKSPYALVFADVAYYTSKLSPSNEIRRYIGNCLATRGEPTPFYTFPYLLPCSPEDVRAGRLQGQPNSIFKATLERCMALQEESYPALTMPRIVPFLIAKVKERGGYLTEGIFRISFQKEALNEMRKQFDSGNYEVTSSSPHAPAALLKEWLRDLYDALVPTDLYPEAIKAAKVMGDIAPASLKAIYDRLEPVNQSVLRELALMAKAISSPEYHAVNRMTMENVAIVFAPSMLRNPSEDPLELLQNTKFETRFTAAFFTYIASMEGPASVSDEFLDPHFNADSAPAGSSSSSSSSLSAQVSAGADASGSSNQSFNKDERKSPASSTTSLSSQQQSDYVVIPVSASRLSLSGSTALHSPSYANKSMPSLQSASSCPVGTLATSTSFSSPTCSSSFSPPSLPISALSAAAAAAPDASDPSASSPTPTPTSSKPFSLAGAVSLPGLGAGGPMLPSRLRSASQTAGVGAHPPPLPPIPPRPDSPTI